MTKSWAELGFKDIAETRMEIGAGAGEDWLRRQPVGVQQHILGQRGQAAWSAGQWPSSEWAVRKDSVAWRGFWTQANQPAYGLPAPPLSEVDSWLQTLPRLDRGETYSEASYWANQGASLLATGGYGPKECINNCNQVVVAMELRARGYDVTAAPTLGTLGRTNISMSADWVDANGQVRRELDIIKNT